jgi:hypothetical protein
MTRRADDLRAALVDLGLDVDRAHDWSRRIAHDEANGGRITEGLARAVRSELESAMLGEDPAAAGFSGRQPMSPMDGRHDDDPGRPDLTAAMLDEGRGL